MLSNCTLWNCFDSTTKAIGVIIQLVRTQILLLDLLDKDATIYDLYCSV